MIAELGHAALYLALGLAIAMAVLPLYGASRGWATLIGFAPAAALSLFGLIGFAFAALIHGFMTSDFSLSVVVANSHSAKPMLYKIAGTWGNHEGSLLMWLFMLAASAAAVAAFGRRLPDDFKARVLAVMAMIAVGFLAFLLFTSNPFARLDPAPLEGNGLNPLLQDPGLAFHPPLLYLGYVGFSVAFAFAVAALIEGRVGPAWARWVRPWTLAAWSLLTLGIALGSWWAYYELGWGGWWFWDPVENASFMPWLAGSALIHSTIVVEKRDSLKAWTILLAILTFSLSLLGTFLVRSGVLTSVHAFATDPARGLFILGFLILVIGGSLVLFAARAGRLAPGGLFAPLSREGALLLNNLLLSVGLATVFVGTLYPLFLDSVTGEKITVGPPFFEAAFVPVMLGLLLLVGIGPLLPWKRADLGGLLPRLKLALGLGLLLPIAAWAMADRVGAFALVGFGVAGWLAGAIITDFFHRLRLGSPGVGQRLIRLPRGVWGMNVAHMGLAILCFAITASGAWQQEKLAHMRVGETLEVAGYGFTLQGVSPQAGPNYTAIAAEFLVERGGKPVAVLRPSSRSYFAPPMQTTEAAIRPLWTGDLYAVIGESGGEGWSVRLYFKPYLSWIWAGALLLALGGGLAISDRRLRLGLPAAAKAKPA